MSTVKVSFMNKTYLEGKGLSNWNSVSYAITYNFNLQSSILNLQSNKE